MVFDMNNPEAKVLLDQLEAASAENTSVIKALDALIKSDPKDLAGITELTEHMEASRIKVADLVDLLQPFRLDS